jgi:crossover junction endodeoxyribonuclease RuvC
MQKANRTPLTTIRIMGIDPGIAATGCGIVSQEGAKLSLCRADTIRTKSTSHLSIRLLEIYSSLRELIEQYQPQAVAVEEVFVARNYKMALKLGQAMGAAKLAAAQARVPVFSYSVLQVKQAVVGYGRADKGQVQSMVTALLNLAKPPSSEHVADSLAVAICHLHTQSLQSRFFSGDKAR